jgi:DNA-binding MarR family transcriptional regulator
MTAGDLAKRLSLTTGAVTSVIDRLASAGLAKRVADPDDRRKVIVQVDARKLHTLSPVYDSMGQAFQKILDTYSTEQLQFLVEFYKASIELTKQEIAKLTAN